MLTNMLVAVDHTESSLCGLRQVLPLARAENCEVVIISVAPLYNGDLRLMGDLRILKDQTQPFKTTLETAHQIAESFGIKVKTVLKEGEAHEQILTQADSNNTDLIVITRKTADPTDLIPMGSVAARIIAENSRDVLVIPTTSQLTLERILLGYDNSENAKKAAEKAVELAIAYGAELTVVTTYEVPLEGFALSPGLWDKISQEAEQLQNHVIHLAEEKGVRKIKTVLRHGRAHEEICRLAEELQAGVIVLGAGRKSGLRRISLGNVVERVISAGVAPVWVASGIP